MRVDFHFYTIYTLARAAGLKPDDAYVIAYASQYTDDETSEDKIYFEDGDIVTPFITAHEIFHPSAISERICERVWIPFHFIPGNLGRGDEVMIARENGPFVQKIIGEFMEYDIRPDSLHMLGIILHGYADTWAHQNFIGLINDMNNISQVRVEGEEENFIEKHLHDLGNKVTPKLGHALAGHIPDEPFRRWSYLDYNDNLHQISNMERAMDAAYHCFGQLSNFLNNFPDLINSEIIAWENMKGEIERLYGFPGKLGDCETEWSKTISKGKFGFVPEGKDINLTYDPNEWYNAAIEEIWRVSEQGLLEKRYVKTNKFTTSDWKYFNDAATFYWANLYGKIGEDEGLPIWGN